ncbi:RHS repeat-associated core domain-containing protein [Pseudomonas viridiflava]|uniref:RHS repeat-associated core domain-containing protein n=1 Tax=Pseudomonas viridiflava TaxID=33069 RepID=UPI0020BFCCD4|nr:RHS repeat-associated core domain-containing protein [Pseudomonas viridiflava]
MPHSPILCRYRYDPLDRLATRAPLAQAVAQAFYRSGILTTEIQGREQRRFLHLGRWLLARQMIISKSSSTSLTATDQQNSVMSVATAGQLEAIPYTPYGHSNPLAHLPGFNGQHPDPITGHYLLGNGYRAFNPLLMRFNSRDSLSPFGKGGLNAYAYCAGDPVNRSDSSGHFWKSLWRGIRSSIRKEPEVPGLKSNVTMTGLLTRIAVDSVPNRPAVKTSSGGTGLADMPYEVIDNITGYLSGADVRRLRLVSSGMRQTVDSVSDLSLLRAAGGDLYHSLTVVVN